MKILEVSRYKDNFADHQLPFVTEQGDSLRQCMVDGVQCTVDYFLVRGYYLTAVKVLKAKIREFQPNIVHAHYGLSGITASLACTPLPFRGEAGREARLVTTFHNGEWHNWWVNLLSSLFALRAKHLIYVAPHVREKMYFKHPHYSILPCGVNMQEVRPTDYHEARQQLGFDPNTKYILFGGAFSNTRKNVAILREALSMIKQSQITNLQSTIYNLQSPIEVIEMKGMDRKTVALHMSACDLFALPTHDEGSPQALKEAMACNCPIVATDCADIAHLLGDLEGHFLLSNKGKSKAEWVGDESSIEELRLKIEEALSLPAGFRTEGRKRIEELGLRNEDVAEKLIKIYKEVLND